MQQQQQQQQASKLFPTLVAANAVTRSTFDTREISDSSLSFDLITDSVLKASNSVNNQLAPGMQCDSSTASVDSVQHYSHIICSNYFAASTTAPENKAASDTTRVSRNDNKITHTVAHDDGVDSACDDESSVGENGSDCNSDDANFSGDDEDSENIVNDIASGDDNAAHSKAHCSTANGQKIIATTDHNHTNVSNNNNHVSSATNSGAAKDKCVHFDDASAQLNSATFDCNETLPFDSYLLPIIPQSAHTRTNATQSTDSINLDANNNNLSTGVSSTVIHNAANVDSQFCASLQSSSSLIPLSQSNDAISHCSKVLTSSSILLKQQAQRNCSTYD